MRAGEPRRDPRRLQSLRGWGHGQTEQVFPEVRNRAVRDGPGARERARVAVGGDYRSPRRSDVPPRRCELGPRGRAGSGQAARTDDRGAIALEAGRARELRAAARQRDPEEGDGVFRPGGARPPSKVMVGFINDHRDALGSNRSARCCRSLRRCSGAPGIRTTTRWSSPSGLYKTEEIHRRWPWKGVEDVEFATLEWVAWSPSDSGFRFSGLSRVSFCAADPLGCSPPHPPPEVIWN